MKKLLLLLIIVLSSFSYSLHAQTNLLTNPSFELWAGGGGGGGFSTPTGWTIVTPQNGTISQNTALFSLGASSCRIRVPANAAGAYTISQAVSVIAGKTYTLKLSYYIETASGSEKDARIASGFRTSPNGTAIAMSLEDSLALKGPGGINSAFPTVTGAWKTYTYDVVTPTNATTFTFAVIVAKGATVSWDNFSLSENTTPTIYKYTYAVATGFNYSPSLTGLDYTNAGAGPSAEQAFTVRASNLSSNLNIAAPTNFEISATSGSYFVAQSSLSIPSTSGLVSPITIYTRLKSGLSSTTYNGNLNISSTGATTQTIPLSGYVGTPLPIVTPSVTTLTGFSYAEGSGPSPQQSFSISGSNLTTGITVTAPANYEISALSGTSFTGTNSITVSQTGGTITATTIYIRLKTGLSSGSYTGNVSLSSGVTTQTIALAGSISGIYVSTTSISGITYETGAGPSAIKTFDVYGLGLSNYLIVSAPANYEISLTAGTAFTATGQILLSSNTTTATPIYLRLKAALAINSYNENITVSSTGTYSKTVALTGAVVNVTSTNAPYNTAVKVYAKNNEIIIDGTANNEIVSVYNQLGMQLKTVQSKGEQLTISVKSASVYLVRTANQTIKVVSGLH